MSNKVVTVGIYSPLVRGAGFIREESAPWNIKVVNSALGGTVQFNFHTRGLGAVEEWIEDGIGRHIIAYSPSLSKIFTGFCNLVQANIGTVQLTRGPFTGIGNRVCVEYSTIEWGTGLPEAGTRDFSDWADNLASQSQYGILEKVVSTAGADETRAEQIRDIALEEMKEPGLDESENVELSSIPSVTLECLGYYHYLDCFTCELTTEGEQYASAKLQAALAEDPNGILSTNYASIQENTTTVGAYDVDRRTCGEIVRALVALGGPALERWLFKLDEDLRPIFGPIPTLPKYQRSLFDPNQHVEFFGPGGAVPPWEVEAGNWIFYTDLLAGLTQPGGDWRTDPRYLFIEDATYNEPYTLALTGTRTGRLKQLLNQFGIGGFNA